MTLEMEQMQALKLKVFHEKEEIRSKLKETYEERDRIAKVIRGSGFLLSLQLYLAE